MNLPLQFSVYLHVEVRMRMRTVIMKIVITVKDKLKKSTIISSNDERFTINFLRHFFIPFAELKRQCYVYFLIRFS